MQRVIPWTFKISSKHVIRYLQMCKRNKCCSKATAQWYACSAINVIIPLLRVNTWCISSASRILIHPCFTSKPDHLYLSPWCEEKMVVLANRAMSSGNWRWKQNNMPSPATACDYSTIGVDTCCMSSASRMQIRSVLLEIKIKIRPAVLSSPGRNML